MEWFGFAAPGKLWDCPNANPFVEGCGWGEENEETVFGSRELKGPDCCGEPAGEPGEDIGRLFLTSRIL